MTLCTPCMLLLPPEKRGFSGLCKPRTALKFCEPERSETSLRPGGDADSDKADAGFAYPPCMWLPGELTGGTRGGFVSPGRIPGGKVLRLGGLGGRPPRPPNLSRAWAALEP